MRRRSPKGHRKKVVITRVSGRGTCRKKVNIAGNKLRKNKCHRDIRETKMSLPSDKT